jgi:hypothetical protein
MGEFQTGCRRAVPHLPAVRPAFGAAASTGASPPSLTLPRFPRVEPSPPARGKLQRPTHRPREGPARGQVRRRERPFLAGQAARRRLPSFGKGFSSVSTRAPAARRPPPTLAASFRSTEKRRGKLDFISNVHYDHYMSTTTTTTTAAAPPAQNVIVLARPERPQARTAAAARPRAISSWSQRSVRREAGRHPASTGRH